MSPTIPPSSDASRSSATDRAVLKRCTGRLRRMHDPGLHKTALNAVDQEPLSAEDDLRSTASHRQGW
jgi:hypothetical protein